MYGSKKFARGGLPISVQISCYRVKRKRISCTFLPYDQRLDSNMFFTLSPTTFISAIRSTKD